MKLNGKYRMKKHSALIVLFLALSLFSVAEAAEYFVSLTGNDKNAGTKEAPFLTITTGIEQLQAGDTLYLRGGEYYITSNVVMYTTQGTAENPIRIMNYNDEDVIIKGCWSIGTDGWVQVDTNDANYEKYFHHMIGPKKTANVYKKSIDYDIWDLYIDNKGQTLDSHSILCRRSPSSG